MSIFEKSFDFRDPQKILRVKSIFLGYLEACRRSWLSNAPNRMVTQCTEHLKARKCKKIGFLETCLKISKICPGLCEFTKKRFDFSKHQKIFQIAYNHVQCIQKVSQTQFYTTEKNYCHTTNSFLKISKNGYPHILRKWDVQIMFLSIFRCN